MLRIRYITHWSGGVFQLKAIPLVKPKSKNGIFVILFNNMVQNVESFHATLVIFFKFYRTNFWLALEQTAGGVIWIISRRRLSRATLKRITYDSSVLFRNKAPVRRSAKRSAWPGKTKVQNTEKHVVKSWNLSYYLWVKTSQMKKSFREYLKKNI